MINILMYVSTGLIIISFIGYFLLVLFSNKKVTNSIGFDITKEIIFQYNSINVIESKGYLTTYNIKRKVIKLSTRCYYGNSLSDISLSLIEAGISIVDDTKNKYIDLFRKIFSNLKILYIFPLIAIIINHLTYNISDANISIIIVILFAVISYMLYDVKSSSYFWISENIGKIKDINKNSCLMIINYINKMLWLDKFIFVGELIMILRFILILLR